MAKAAPPNERYITVGNDFLNETVSRDLANDELEILSRIDENHHDKLKDNDFITERGIKFKVQKVSATLIMESRHSIAVPVVPRIHIEEDDRWEENPSDPTYLEQMARYRELTSINNINIMLGLGTYTQREWCPEGIDFWKDENATEWVENLEFAGIKVPDKRLARYVAWIKFYAVTDNEEIGNLINKVAVYSGLVKEQEVISAMETFPDNETSGIDPEPYTEGEDTYRD